MKNYAANLNQIREAGLRIKGAAHVTPVITCSTLDRIAGKQLFFKCENLQKAGAFKFRGACNAIQKLPESSRQRGLVTHSSGNHAGALALAAKMARVPAHVVMPSNALAVKKQAVLEYGARIVECEPNLEARETTAARVLEETGGNLIPPFDHPDIIAGQGTVAVEFLDQVKDMQALIAPVGGGGLLSGVALAAHELDPKIVVIGAEPAGADDAAQSKKFGTFIPQTAPNTIADGLLTSMGEYTWPVIRDLVDAIITVTDDQITAAMRLFWERSKLIVEPSAAVGIAAVLQDGFKNSGLKRVGIVLSGGNVDLDKLPWL